MSPVGVPRDAAAVLEQTIAKVSRSVHWKDYIAKNMYEDVYMNGEEFGCRLAARNASVVQFLIEMGLANPKKWRK